MALRLQRTALARGALVAVFAASAACSSTASRSDAVPLSYDIGNLAPEHVEALARSEEEQFGPTGPRNGDLGLVVDPQPSGLRRGEVLVAIDYEACGPTRLGEAYVETNRLVIEVVELPLDPGVDGCVGTGVLAGVRLNVPEGQSITPETRVVLARRPR